MVVRIPRVSTDLQGRGGAGDGVAGAADGALDLLGIFDGFDHHLAHGDPDALLVVNPDSEAAALRDGAQLYSNSLEYFDLTATARASVIAGAGPLRKAIQPVASRGVGQWPLSGCMATDEFTLQFKLKPVGQSLLLTGVGGALTSGLLACVAGINRLDVAKVNTAGNASFTLSASLSVDERGFRAPGSNNLVTASLTLLTDSDIPVDEWTTITVTFNGATLRLILGDNAKTATGAYSGSWLKRPWDGDPMWSSGLFVGSSGVVASAGTTFVAVSDAAVYRWGRTYGQQRQTKGPTLAVAPQTTQGTFLRNVAGVVGHYTGWARNEADEVAQAAARNRQIGLATDAGLPLVRIAEFSERAVPTINASAPGSITSIDWTGWDAHLARWAGVGCDVTMHIGYTPVAFGGGADGALKPTVAGLTQAQVNTLYADYASQAIGRAKAALGAGHIKAIAFWNEPENFGPESWTTGVFFDLFAACSAKLATDHPDLPRLGTPDSSAAGGTMWQGVVDRAFADGLPLGSDHLHSYDHSLTAAWEHLDDHLGYLATKGFSAVPQFLTEWNYTVNYPQQPPRLQSLEHRPTTEFNAAYVHAMVEALIRRGGVQGAAFFRLGMQSTVSAVDAGEESCGLINNGTNGKPTPAWCAFELLWKHATTKVSATSNYPNWGVLASKDATTGRIVVSYHHRTLNRAMALRAASIEWGTLPATFTWKHWVVDKETNGMGRPLLLASGTQANLPISVLPRSHMAVGCIEITP